MREPLLSYSRPHEMQHGNDASTGSSWLLSHLGTDSQRSAWIVFCVATVMFFEQIYSVYTTDGYFASAVLYLSGAFLGVIGCYIFVKSSYPDSIATSCLYSNGSVCPKPNAWCLVVNFGTRVLRGAHLQLWGSLLYAAGSAVWIKENYYLYGLPVGESLGSIFSSPSWEYTCLVAGGFLLAYGAYWQLQAQYPMDDSSRTTAAATGSQNTTSSQMHGWCWMLLSILWLVRSAIYFDSSTSIEGPLNEDGEHERIPVPFMDYDWVSFLNCAISVLFGLGSYFVLASAYREGSRIDVVLIQQANRETGPVDVETGGELVTVVGVPLEKKNLALSKHPLEEVFEKERLGQIPPNGEESIRMVLKKSRNFMYEETGWVRQTLGFSQKNSDLNLTVYHHKTAHAVKFETTRFRNIDPLLLAALIQSDLFKSHGGSTVSVLSKLPQGGILFHVKSLAHAPMPAHESVVASVLHETRRNVGEDAAELVEWSSNAIGNVSTSPPLVKVPIYRFVTVSSKGKLTVAVWLEEIARWMPHELVMQEMRKVPGGLVSSIELFLEKSASLVPTVEKQLSTWIWQKLHNSISPLSAAVLVRFSPAYRVLLAKFPGLRTKIPDSISVPAGAMEDPLDFFPKQILNDADVHVPVLAKHGSDFVSNDFGAWEPASEEYKQKIGRARILVWRRKEPVKNQVVQPFRIQVRVHGIDPLTLAYIIQRNKLNDVVCGLTSVVGSQERRASLPPTPLGSVYSVVPPSSPLRSSAGGGDIETAGAVVSSSLVASFQGGTVRVYSERKRHAKLMVAARDREFTFCSILKDLNPLKAVVVHFGVDNCYSSANSASVVPLRKFHAWTLENDGGSDTKLTWAGLVPMGGRTEKISAWVNSGAELKEKIQFAEKLANIFATDNYAKEAMAETHAYIAYFAIRTAIHRELKKMSLTFLSNFSVDYKALVSEIQPTALGPSEKSHVNTIMGFDQDILVHNNHTKRHSIQKEVLKSEIKKNNSNTRQDQNTVFVPSTLEEREIDELASEAAKSVSSIATIPLSPVSSHVQPPDEVRTQKNDDSENDDLEHDVIPNERDAR